MTAAAPRFSLAPRWLRLPLLLKRRRERRLLLDRDVRLLLTIIFILAAALAACHMTIREVERHLLRTAAAGAAVHWAEFLQSRLRGLDEILAAGLVTEEDQRIFEFAGAAGNVRDYQVIRPDGVVALSNWSGDFRGATDSEILRQVLKENRTVAKVTDEDYHGDLAVIGQAYVPLASGGGRQGALKVDVDVTSQAEYYRSLGNGAFSALIAFMLPLCGLAGWLVARNILARRTSERLQRQRGLVLEALTQGAKLERVLRRIERFAEVNSRGARCTVFMLGSADQAAPGCIVRSPLAADGKAVDQPVLALPKENAPCLKGECPALRGAVDEETLWSSPLQATTGGLLGCMTLRFSAGVPSRPPDPEGAIVALAQLAAFVIEARRAEEALAEMRQRNELILGAAADGIFGIDAEGRITFANPAGARLLGRSVVDMIGVKADAVLQPPSRQGDGGSPVAATLMDRLPRLVEKTEVRGADGKALPVKLAVNPIAEPVSSLCAVVVIHDISAQIAAQQDLSYAKDAAEAASRSKSLFLAHMSHELRTPLNAIIGFSEMVAEQTLGPVENPRYLEYARHIHASGAHLLSLINDLLDLSKIEAGKLELCEELKEMQELFERCRIFVEESAQHKGVRLAIDRVDHLPPLWCDSRKLKQVVVNLLSNAIKFTRPGGCVHLAAELKGDDMIIRVADNGVGIAPQDIDNVMAPFGQAREALVRDHDGTGLGLPLAKMLVELHGGSLELESRLGEGTTVTVRLPGRARPAATPSEGARRLTG